MLEIQTFYANPRVYSGTCLVSDLRIGDEILRLLVMKVYFVHKFYEEDYIYCEGAANQDARTIELQYRAARVIANEQW